MDAPEQLLRIHWQHAAFRPAQRDIIQASLAGHDVLALLPTGGGKSLCYQLPALLREGLTLVVSPLLSLMHDQVGALAARSISAAVLAGASGAGSVRATLQAAARGTYKLLYLSPERLYTRDVRAALPYIPVSAVAIDEAHCISQWGHDFRPEYLRIQSLREVFPQVPFAAFTATATANVEGDIIKYLGLRDHFKRFQESYERENIFYRVEAAANRTTSVAAAIAETGGPAIVYCGTRRRVDEVARALNADGLNAIAYHAGLNAETRHEAQESWMEGEVETIVATTAFGMGIDRSDVRLVVHYDAPADLESFYQETGRAGRDNQPAHALTFFEPRDGKKLLTDVARRFPPEAFLRKVYQAVAEYLQIPTGCEVEQYFPFDLLKLCTRFKLPKADAAAAMRLLESEGLWTITDAVFRPATAHFLVDRPTYDAFAIRHPQLALVATALLRLYGQVFHRPTVVHVAAVAKLLRVRPDIVTAAFTRLEEAGILRYDEPGTGPLLHVHHYRVESAHLLLDLERLRSLRQAALLRAEAMRGFLEDRSTCRVGSVLKYFGQSPSENCGHCDVCADIKKTAHSSKSLRARLTAAISEMEAPAHTILAAFRGTERATAVRELRSLIDEGIVLQQNGKLHLRRKTGK